MPRQFPRGFCISTCARLNATSWCFRLRVSVLQMLLQLTGFSIVWRNLEGTRQFRFCQIGLALLEIDARESGAIYRRIAQFERGLQLLNCFGALVFAAIDFGHSAMRRGVMRSGGQRGAERLFGTVQSSRHQLL